MKRDALLYKCMHCGHEVKLDLSVAKKVICSYCGYRILQKFRTDVPKHVRAR